MRNKCLLLLLISIATMGAQETQSDKNAERRNQIANPGDNSDSVLDVKPGSPTIKTKDIVRERKITPWVRLPRYLIQDQKAIWTSPFHTTKADRKWWLIFGGATAGLIASDRWTSKQLPNTNDQLAVARWTSKFGGAPFLLPATAAFYFVGLGADNQRFRETGILGFEALGNTELVVIAAKLVTHRERPLEGNGNGTFMSGNGSIWNSSFPSGHAINSWAFASIVAHEYPRPLIVPILAYGLAGTVVASRFAARQHFASDVILGGAMGWFIGDYVYAKRHNRELENLSRLDRVISHLRLGGPTHVEMPADAEAVKSAALRTAN